ncbi:hypothetical protein [Streptomyces jumonjinensis]|uniref:hypothetical protein n=1 Tax=Streptomyces jumonjinensis TaxID=1945 RepID=UPI0037AAC74D
MPQPGGAVFDPVEAPHGGHQRAVRTLELGLGVTVLVGGCALCALPWTVVQLVRIP